MRKLGTLLMVLSTLSVSPAYAGSASVQPEAVILRRLSFVQVDDLEFGAILAGSTAGTVVVSPTGVRTKTGGVTLMGGLVQQAVFAGYGSNGQNVAISINANTQTMTRVGGTETMTYGTFLLAGTPTTPLTTTPRTFRISSTTGVFNFTVGATLNVAANQRPGQYADTFTITLNYL
jgi:hypothetical protein